MGYNPYRKKVVKPGDKWIFVAIALAVGASSVAGIILLAFAAIMLLTGAVAMCPIYRLLGLSTCHVAAKGRA